MESGGGHFAPELGGQFKGSSSLLVNLYHIITQYII